MIASILLASALCADEPPVTVYEGYELAWHDEFNRPGAPDPRWWGYEEGFVRNHEAQLYRRENVRVAGGVLVIEARREIVPNPAYDPKAPTSDWKRSRKEAGYTSGCIKTAGKIAWTFGRFEMRARIDVRPGLWPAFWTVGSHLPWPSCGEIDIMEAFRGTLLANAAWGTERRAVARWRSSRTPFEKLALERGLKGPSGWLSRFHVWRMDWDERTIRLTVDGRVLNEIDLSKTINASADHINPFHQDHQIILNLAVGGDSGGDPSATTFPAKFEVDWVRVYRRNQ